MSTTPSNSRFRNLLNKKLLGAVQNNNHNNNNGGVPAKVKLLNVWKKAKNNATQKRFRRQLLTFRGDPQKLRNFFNPDDKTNPFDLRIFQVEDSEPTFKVLSVLRSILLDIKHGKFKLNPKTGLPDLHSRINMSTPTNIFIHGKASSAIEHFIVGLLQSVGPIGVFGGIPAGIAASSGIVEGIALADATGISAGVVVTFLVIFYVARYVDQKRTDKHTLESVVKRVTTDELIEKIDKILQGQPIETVENPLFDAQRAELAQAENHDPALTIRSVTPPRNENELRTDEMVAASANRGGSRRNRRNRRSHTRKR